MNDVLRALNLAKTFHENQKYGSGAYTYHLEQVAQLCKDFGWSEEEQIVAAFHDAIEDNEDEKDSVYNTIKKEFGIKIADAVRTMSKDPNDDYFKQYLVKVSKNELSKRVKFCDIICNMENCAKDGETRKSLLMKYRKALLFLSGIDFNFRSEE